MTKHNSRSIISSKASLKDALWHLWTNSEPSSESRITAINAEISELETDEKIKLIEKISNELGPSALSTPLDASNLPVIILVIQYCLFGFDSGSIDIIDAKISSFCSTSSIEIDIVHRIYSRIGDIS